MTALFLYICRNMFRVAINIIFILLLSLVIFPVKEASASLLAKQCTQPTTPSNQGDDQDDEDDATADMVKKIDFKLKFEIAGRTGELAYQAIQTNLLHYADYGFLLPPNHAADVQTPPPNC